MLLWFESNSVAASLGAEGKSRLPKGAKNFPEMMEMFCVVMICRTTVYICPNSFNHALVSGRFFTACKLLLNKADLNIQYSVVFFFSSRRVLAGELEPKFPLCSCIAVNP